MSDSQARCSYDWLPASRADHAHVALSRTVGEPRKEGGAVGAPVEEEPLARARFAEIQAVEAEVSDLTERLESRKVVERAKGLLQSGLGLSEPEAFRWIQKTAMDLRKSMREVAEGVIEHGSVAKKK